MAYKKFNILNSCFAQQPPPALKSCYLNPLVQNLVPPAKKQIQDMQKLLRNSTTFRYPSKEITSFFKTQDQAEPARAASQHHCILAAVLSQQFSARQRTVQFQGEPGLAQSIQPLGLDVRLAKMQKKALTKIKVLSLYTTEKSEKHLERWN